MNKILPAIFFSFLLLGATPLIGMKNDLELWFDAGVKNYWDNNTNEALMVFDWVSTYSDNVDLKKGASFWTGVINYGLHGEKPNYQKARKCFEEVAKYNGNPKIQARACLFLGQMYFFGRGVAQDLTRAHNFFNNALLTAKKDDLWIYAAIYEMQGLLCYFDPAPNADYDKVEQAQFFLDDAAKQNVNTAAKAESLCFLGYIYYRAAINKRGLMTMGPKQCYEKACNYFMQVLEHRDYSIAATKQAELLLKNLEEFKKTLQ